MTRILRYVISFVGIALLTLSGSMVWAQEQETQEKEIQAFSMDPEVMIAGFFEEAPAKALACCIPDGSVDDTLGKWSCCSGYAVSGSTVCTIPSDYGTTWASCRHVCGTRPVNGCIPSGGIDDTLSNTYGCSGSAVPGSTWCLDPRDYGTDWKSCVQTCQ